MACTHGSVRSKYPTLCHSFVPCRFYYVFLRLNALYFQFLLRIGVVMAMTLVLREFQAGFAEVRAGSPASASASETGPTLCRRAGLASQCQEVLPLSPVPAAGRAG